MVLLYIDPGTGSMLFTIILGVIGAAVYFVRTLFLKLKFRVEGGSGAIATDEKHELVIFAESRTYFNFFKPVCDELERRKQKAVYMTSSQNDPIFETGYEYVTGRYIGEGNKAYAFLNMLNAKVVLATTPNLDVFQWKRSKKAEYYIHLLHMCTDPSLYRMFALDYYDAVLISGDYHRDQIRALEKLRALPEKAVEAVGAPYMDVLDKRATEKKTEESHSLTVLLAPTWGEHALLKRYGEDIIDRLIDTGYHLIIRPHPQSFISEKELMDRLTEKYPGSDKLEWNRDLDNFDVLSRSDILVSDFSGVILDYALVFDKPVIYTKPELNIDEYDAVWLDEQPWIFKTLPKIGYELSEENMKDIGSVIEKCLGSREFAKGRETARQECWAHRGEGAVKTVDFLMEKLKAGAEKGQE